MLPRPAKGAATQGRARLRCRTRCSALSRPPSVSLLLQGWAADYSRLSSKPDHRRQARDTLGKPKIPTQKGGLPGRFPTLSVPRSWAVNQGGPQVSGSLSGRPADVAGHTRRRPLASADLFARALPHQNDTSRVGE